MLRLVTITLAVSALTIQAASGDEVHRTSFAADVIGTWAPHPELCGTADKSNIEIAATTYTGAAGKCTVETIVERAGTAGPFYSARAHCSDASGKSRIAYLIVQAAGNDKVSIGSTLNDLKTYQRCPAKS